MRERRQLLQSRSLRGRNRDLRVGPGAGLLESGQRSVHAGILRRTSAMHLREWSTRTVCDDDNVCTDDACVPATGDCSYTPKPPEFCDDNDPCTEDVCDPQDGCVSTPADPPPAECAEAICRTPGFWGTHAGTEKSPGNGQPAVNITEAVIDCADGNCDNHTASDFLLICGERIDSPDSNPADGTTDTDDAASSTEAMCVDV